MAARTMTDAFSRGVAAHQAQQLKEAEELYRSCLKEDPQHADAMHQLGALLMEAYGESKFEEARGLIQAAINARPREGKFRHSLGVALRAVGRKQEAVEAFERANEKDPMNVQILWNLARTLKELGRPMRAAEVYKSVTLLQPDHPQAHYRRAGCLRQVGRYEEALASFRAHLRICPDDREAAFWVAAITGDTSVPVASATPSDLVAGLFDQYADNFDSHLVGALGYRTPQLLMDVLSAAAAQAGSSSGGSGHRWGRCVDLGCGTGLMGALLRPHVAPGGLEGVDLSAGMVKKAEARGLYDHLEVAELVQYLNQQPVGHGSSACAAGSGTCAASSSSGGSGGKQQQPYDCLVAADVFVYIGDLQPVLSAASAKSCKGALLAFSTEAYERSKFVAEGAPTSASPHKQSDAAVPDEAAATLFRVNPTGRYCHSKAYLEWVLKATGWKLIHSCEEEIRQNGGKPVIGHLCVAVRL